jgi:hypothetical protein
VVRIRATGRDASFNVVHVVTLRDGLVVRFREYADRLGDGILISAKPERRAMRYCWPALRARYSRMLCFCAASSVGTPAWRILSSIFGTSISHIAAVIE